MAVAGGGGPRNVQVSPSAVHPGGILTITVDGCRRGGVVSSNAFPDATLSPADRGSGGSPGERGDRDFGGNGGNGGDGGGRGGNGGDGGGNGRGGDGGGRGGDGFDGRGGNGGGDGVGGNGRGGEMVATARVRNNATPGNYSLTVRCNDNGQTATASFRVLSGRGAQGGLGGSIGPSKAEMAIGAGLVATAAVGGSLFIVRRRRTVGGPA
ncbi:hypothetical protein ACWGJT_13030 [Streptomyces xantholiticus]